MVIKLVNLVSTNAISSFLSRLLTRANFEQIFDIFFLEAIFVYFFFLVKTLQVILSNWLIRLIYKST